MTFRFRQGVRVSIICYLVFALGASQPVQAQSSIIQSSELRDALSMTDGNLTTHIRTLQEAGYLSVAKSYQNNRPLTTCSLTASGRKAFGDYVDLLEKIVQQTRKLK